MKLFQRTNSAKAIIEQGFRDGTGNYLTERLWRGVWLSDQPLDENEGAPGDSILTLEIPEDGIIDFEWIEVGKPYREFLVPADWVNRFGPAEFSDDAEY